MLSTEALSKTYGEIYLSKLSKCFNKKIYQKIDLLAFDLLNAWENKRNIFLCGNGGSGANAIHIANDLLYGSGACGEGTKLPGLRVDALTANQGIITCLSNDVGYENVFSHQLKVKGERGDLLIALSGSGNSQNIINAINTAKEIGIKSYAILGFKGGKCLEICDQPIHVEINDMQIAEDAQTIIGHICMQWLTKNKIKNVRPI